MLTAAPALALPWRQNIKLRMQADPVTCMLGYTSASSQFVRDVRGMIDARDDKTCHAARIKSVFLVALRAAMENPSGDARER